MYFSSHQSMILVFRGVASVGLFYLFSLAQVEARPLWSGANTGPGQTSAGDWAQGHQVHTSGAYSTTIPGRGHLGTGFARYEFYYEQVPSFEYPKDSDIEYLFGGSLWVGGIVGFDTLVSVGTSGWSNINEFVPLESSDDVTVIPGKADQNFRSAYVDTDPLVSEHRPLNIRVTQTSRSWETEPYDDALVIEYIIVNVGSDTIKQFWVGSYHDADIGSSADEPQYFVDDLTGYLADDQIAYAIDNDGNNLNSEGTSFIARAAYGVKVLDFQPPAPGPPNYNWWFSNGNPELDFGPRLAGTPEDPFRDFGGVLGTAVGDANKHYLLSHNERDYDQLWVAVDNSADGWLPPPEFERAADYANGFDTRFLISQGGVDLPPGDSALFVIAVVIGDNVHVDSMNFSNYHSALTPESFYNVLDFSELKANTAAIKGLYESGYNTAITSPPPRVQFVDSMAESLVIEWVYSDNEYVSGYNVYLAEIPSWLVFCDLLPIDTPYICAADQRTFTPITSDTFALPQLKDGAWYQVGVAVAETEGPNPRISEPLVFRYGTPAAPELNGAFENADQNAGSYQVNNHNVTFSWDDPNDDVVAFNIYRFTDYDPEKSIVTPLSINEGLYCDTASTICDTVIQRADTTTYCISHITPHATVYAPFTSFGEHIDSAAKFYYQVTVVDSIGAESVASSPLTVYVRPENLRPLAIYMYDTTTYRRFSRMEYDSLTDWYQSAMSAYNPLFIRKRAPLIGSDEPRLGYKDLGACKSLLIDDPTRWVGMLNGSESAEEDQISSALRDFVRVGGQIIYLGSGSSISNNQLGVDEANISAFSAQAIGRTIFGLDSLTFIGPHTPDSLYDPVGAAATATDWPYLTYHHSLWRYPASENEGPIRNKGVLYPAGDKIIDTLYSYISGNDPVSHLHGLPVGIKHSAETHTAYTILSSPYEWEIDQAQAFFAKIFDDFPTDVVLDDEDPALPSEYALSQNYPNPFNPSTTIQYAMPRAGDVSLTVYNILGQKVATLLEARVEAGNHAVNWDAVSFATGVYFVRLKTGDKRLTRKMVLLK